MDRSPPTPVAGDPDRLAQMFKAHRGVIWRMLRCRGLAPDVAADATQEVFLVAAQRLQDIAVGKERSFLIGTALHVDQAAQRARSRWQLQEGIEAIDRGGDHARARALARAFLADYPKSPLAQRIAHLAAPAR
jgi:DNA-directed RNA polymerase specialized sigma24 family protein